MTHSSDAPEFILTEWRQALRHACVIESDFHLISCPGRMVKGAVSAAHYEKGRRLTGDPDEGEIVTSSEKLAEANAPENVDRHRVAILEEPEADVPAEPLFGGLLRHEIEHAKQRDANPEAYSLYELVHDVTYGAFDNDDEAREVFHTSPFEADSNAAAASYLREFHPEAIAQLGRGRHHVLVNSTSESDPETLLTRAVDYLWRYRDGFAAPAEATGEEVIERDCPQAAQLWRERVQAEHRGGAL
jgi:hypothetical protein